MAKELVISAPAHERRVAILDEGQLVEIYIERENEFALVGSIYKGRVTRVLPGMQSAFVDIGLDGDAFLYVSDVFENLEDYEPAGTHSESHAIAPEPPALPALSEGEAQPAAEPQEEFSAEMEHAGATSGEDVPAAESQPDAQPSEYAAGTGTQPQPGFSPRNDFDRNRSGQNSGSNPRHGDDRGGPGRFGRRGGRGRGGRRPDHGRNLPPSKYASPQGQDSRRFDQRGSAPDQRGFDQRNRDPRGPEPPRFSAPPDTGEEQILLPGESLAKYRGKTPATMLPPDEPTPSPSELREQNAESAAPQATDATGTAQRAFPRLPSWVLADAGAEAAPAQAQELPEGTIESSAPAADVEELATQLPTASFTSSRPESDLSDEQVAALASQLAEAKHEETQAEAEADASAGGAVFEEENGAEEDAHQDEIHEDEVHEEEIREDETEAIRTAEPSSEEDAAEMTHEEEADAAHNEAIASVGQAERELVEAAPGGTSPAAIPGAEDDLLLPGETRAPRDSSRPAEFRSERPRDDRPRDSARIGGNPRSRFQRPDRGGRDRGRGGRPPRRDERPPQRDGRPPQRFERRPQGGPSQHRSGPPRRPQLISEMLKAGQDIVVQIAKEPLGKKGARITSHVALPGRYLVYMPTVNHIGVSRKIAAADNRSRLRRLVGEANASYPGGFIVRTAAGEATDDEIRADIEFLGNTWNQIKHRNDERKAPNLLHRDLNLVERILRDYVNDEYTSIWIDNEEEYSKIVEFVNRFQPKLVNRIKLYTKETPIFEEFGIQHELDKALRPKVWLKSGGYIVINHTEALVAIDVNTGKYVGKGSTRLEDTIVKTNVEAVKEIVRQIRLRDLGGIIVVDFIDMEERRNREKVLSALQQALDQDKAPSKALSFNEFGLVCITRKRTKQALERVLCQPCPYCTGSGMVKSIPTLCYEIQAEARKMAGEQEDVNLTLRVHPEIAKALKTRESMLIDELEQNTHKHVIIQSDATLHWEQYDIY